MAIHIDFSILTGMHKRCFSMEIKPVIKQREYDGKAKGCKGKILDEEIYWRYRRVIEEIF